MVPPCGLGSSTPAISRHHILSHLHGIERMPAARSGHSCPNSDTGYDVCEQCIGLWNRSELNRPLQVDSTLQVSENRIQGLPKVPSDPHRADATNNFRRCVLYVAMTTYLCCNSNMEEERTGPSPPLP